MKGLVYHPLVLIFLVQLRHLHNYQSITIPIEGLARILRCSCLYHFPRLHHHHCPVLVNCPLLYQQLLLLQQVLKAIIMAELMEGEL
jgi:hypothetical protein